VDAVFDGMNEKGLAANLLELAENDFSIATASIQRPRLSFAAWTLYLLSQYATMKELVVAVQQDRIQVVPVPSGLVARLRPLCTWRSRMPVGIQR
jgi:penicillin V acylase-like amidase (Ntn superfamily)